MSSNPSARSMTSGSDASQSLICVNGCQTYARSRSMSFAVRSPVTSRTLNLRPGSRPIELSELHRCGDGLTERCTQDARIGDERRYEVGGRHVEDRIPH